MVGGNLHHAREVHHAAVAAAPAPALEQLTLRLQTDGAAARVDVSAVAGFAPTVVTLAIAPTDTVVCVPWRLRSTNAAALHAPPRV